MPRVDDHWSNHGVSTLLTRTTLGPRRPVEMALLLGQTHEFYHPSHLRPTKEPRSSRLSIANEGTTAVMTSFTNLGASSGRSSSHEPSSNESTDQLRRLKEERKRNFLVQPPTA